jgi:hypothetical protein
MFTLLSVFIPKAAMAEPTQNTFSCFAIEMPGELIPALQDRLFSVIMHRYYSVNIKHDLTTEALIRLHDRLIVEKDTQTHNFALNGYLLQNLHRFLRVERALAVYDHPRLSRKLSNVDYWRLSNKLLHSIKHPTQLTKLSFFA